MKESKSKDLALLSYLGRYIKPQSHLLIIAAIALFIAMGLDLLRPYLTKLVIDEGFVPKDGERVFHYAFLYTISIIASIIIVFIENYMLKSFGQRIIFDIRNKVFQRIIHKSQEDFDAMPLGNWVTRVTNDVEALRTLYTDVVLKLISSGLFIIGILVSMYAINVTLAVVMTMLLPVMAVIIWMYQKYARRAFRAVRTSVAASNSSIQELLNYIVIIKTYVGEKIIESRYDSVNRDFLKAGLFEVTTFSIFKPIVDALFFVALIVIFGVTNWFDSVTDAGTVFAFIQYMDKFFQPMKEIAEKYNSLQSSLAGAERLVPILEEADEPVTHHALDWHHIDSIEFDHVWFSYDHNDTYALKDITFKVDGGQFVGIVGPSGGGKSTLLSLLMGIHTPTKGRILINGIDMSDYDSSVMRSIMGYVFQSAHLFKGSIRENLALYEDGLSDEVMFDATRKVGLHQMIKNLPEGYDTPVGYLGSLLSGGQKQLLAFARTLIKDKPILLLDEATSNVDSHTEQQIQKSIEVIRGEKTIINIAHRLSSVQLASTIYMIENGSIVETGSFQELMNMNGKFKTLWEHQHSI